jgi:outer membrane protein OmpA-like peptidoglycan-associated protein
MFDLRFLYRVAAAVAAVTALHVSGSTVLAQQGSRNSLFSEANQALESAQEARADILAPRGFGEGMKRYQEAERDLERGRSSEDVRKKLVEAVEFFEQATAAAQLAYPTLSEALAARDDAAAAEASEYAADLWMTASDLFEKAAREHEGGDVEDAREKADEAEALYRDAELQAIKANYLQETWDLLMQAKDGGAQKRAPVTLANAEALVTEAEQLLSDSRYDTDEPRWLAQQARREAMHAIYLAGIVRAIEDEELTFEDVMLAGEDQLARIASALQVASQFETGMSSTTDAIVAEVEAYQDSLAGLGIELMDRTDQVAVMGARVVELETRTADLEQELGGLTEERTALVNRMDEQARLRQKFATVERMFSRDEARVLREGADVTIRLLTLSFEVGQSEIDPSQRDVLDRLQRAILEFPGSRVTVEGHTDSFGSDATNLRLSQERAQAVRSYLLGNPGLQPSLIEATGYGETRPVASNDTREGRARNRRTDVIIHTDIGMGY